MFTHRLVKQMKLRMWELGRYVEPQIGTKTFIMITFLSDVCEPKLMRGLVNTRI